MRQMSQRPGGTAVERLSSRWARSSRPTISISAPDRSTVAGRSRDAARASERPPRRRSRCRSGRHSSTARAWTANAQARSRHFPADRGRPASTRHPIAASAVARLIAVVVLPDPALLVGDRDPDHVLAPSPPSRRRLGIRVGDTPFHVKLTLPRPPRFGQFRSRALRPLGSTHMRFSCGQMMGYLEQTGKRRDGTGGDHVVMFPRRAPPSRQRQLTSSRSNSHALWRKSARSRRGSTKSPGRSTRQAITMPGRPAPEPRSIHDAPSPARTDELGEIEDVALPHRFERRGETRFCGCSPREEARRSASSFSNVSRETGRDRRPRRAGRSRRSSRDSRDVQRGQSRRRDAGNARRLVKGFRPRSARAARPSRWRGPGLPR